MVQPSPVKRGYVGSNPTVPAIAMWPNGKAMDFDSMGVGSIPTVAAKSTH